MFMFILSWANGVRVTSCAIVPRFRPDVRFHPAGPAQPATRGRDQALAWYDDRHARGIRTQVEETFTYPTPSSWTCGSPTRTIPPQRPPWCTASSVLPVTMSPTSATSLSVPTL
ncbi:hypothetical protein [Streptacidiphilus sp. MAP5-3]|uniref:hypothetical protein n=1 Tax=unclassified Streptacidiphilus TaxID=2643834 RepID=UPI0035173468